METGGLQKKRPRVFFRQYKAQLEELKCSRLVDWTPYHSHLVSASTRFGLGLVLALDIGVKGISKTRPAGPGAASLLSFARFQMQPISCIYVKNNEHNVYEWQRWRSEETICVDVQLCTSIKMLFLHTVWCSKFHRCLINADCTITKPLFVWVD